MTLIFETDPCRERSRQSRPPAFLGIITRVRPLAFCNACFYIRPFSGCFNVIIATACLGALVYLLTKFDTTTLFQLALFKLFSHQSTSDIATHTAGASHPSIDEEENDSDGSDYEMPTPRASVVSVRALRVFFAHSNLFYCET